jgi:hypothetical protein
MMPPLAVFEIAPANVLQGAVRLHGLTSSPTPETHVRVAWAKADKDVRQMRIAIITESLLTVLSPPERIVVGRTATFVWLAQCTAALTAKQYPVVMLVTF